VNRILPLALFLVACTKASTTAAPEPTSSTAATATPAPTPSAPATAASGAGALPDDADCNLATPLVAGIPGSPGHLIPSPRNPNGDSEMAVLMRKFVDDLRDARTLVEAGQPTTKLYPTHRKMRCAWLTKPEERTASFDAMAVGYLTAVRAFDDAPAKASFNRVLDSCVACHSATCGGVIEFIDSLRWQ
jgi:hypothetical protein